MVKQNINLITSFGLGLSKFIARIGRLYQGLGTTYQDARRVRLVDGLALTKVLSFAVARDSRRQLVKQARHAERVDTWLREM